MDKKEYAPDRLFNLFVITGVLLVRIGVALWLEGDIQGGWLGCGIGGFFLVVCMMVVPCLYAFDEAGVTIFYVFWGKERYLWKNIRAIREKMDTQRPKDILLDMMFSQVFELSGRVEGKHRFYMQGTIRRSRRTKRLIKAHWRGIIT